MKKIIICFIIILSMTGCEQSQEQSQIENIYYVERPNFNSVPWSTIDLVDGIGEVKIERIKKEFEKGKFKDGKDFEERAKGILSPEMIGLIGQRYDFEVVEWAWSKNQFKI